MLVPLGIFALLESGCSEVWRNGQTLIGIEQGDPDNQVELAVRNWPDLNHHTILAVNCETPP
jgi:hypothetical protein